MLSWIRCASVAALVLSASPAFAVPVTYQIDSLTNTSTTWTLVNAPIVGSGDLVLDASGNLLSGSLFAPAFAFLVEATGDGVNDFRFDLTATTQTLAAASLIGGKIDLAGGIATGTSTCTLLPGAAPGGVCPPPSAVLAFGTDGPGAVATVTLEFTRFNGPSDFAGTVTSVTVRTAQNGAVSTQTLIGSFATLAVPEPGTLALLAAPLVFVALARLRRT